MSCGLRLATLMAAGALLQGCVAVAIPAIASSAIAGKEVVAKRARPVKPAPAAPLAPAEPQVAQRPVLPPPPAGGAVPAGMQFLFGSGESAALSLQAYAMLTAYLKTKAAEAKRGELVRQVVLSDGASFDNPYFDPCGRKPLTVVFDIDETLLLNLGYGADEAQRGVGYDAARWNRWEQTGATKVAAAPGAAEAIRAARALGYTVMFNSNRSSENAAATEDALAHAGLGPAKHGATLWLKGDDGGGSGKDDRRWAISSGYCVVAMVGDQLGDFSDLFDDPELTPAARRAAADAPLLKSLWGDGWFVLPNPVYGTALAGGVDDVFPPDKRWTDPAEEQK